VRRQRACCTRWLILTHSHFLQPPAAELPYDDVAIAAGGAVLYPASTQARAELGDGLAARGCGFALSRLNTYSTAPAATLPPGAAAAAAAAAVVTFASPSAVKAYRALLHDAAAANSDALAFACIGETSASAAAAAGLRRVHFPDAPGVEGWAAAVEAALQGAPPRDDELAARAAARRAAAAAS
jgi:uroporphyrinogen-III synthase